MKGRDFTLAEAYASASAELPESDPWVAQVRSNAAASLRRSGFPGRGEAWKFTRSSRLLQETFTPVIGAPASVTLPEGPYDGQPRIVFVDGIVDPALSTVPTALPSGDLRERMGDALGDPDGFAALGLAFVHGPSAIVVDDSEHTGPLHLVHVCTGSNRLAAVRHVVHVGRAARLELVEHFLSVGSGPSLTTAATEVFLADGAQVDHVRVAAEDHQALHVGAVGAVVPAGARYRFTSVVLGGALARVEVVAKLVAPGASAELSGLTMARDRQHVDHHVLVDHEAPEGTSDQTFRTVLDDRARSVYTGAVAVRRGAVGTDSNQLHHALLLSDDAVANVRPWLEIDNDDVKCAHGAAIGGLDDDSLFYMRQRGLSEMEARSLLTAGFAASSLEAVPEGPLRAWLMERCSAWLGAT